MAETGGFLFDDVVLVEGGRPGRVVPHAALAVRGSRIADLGPREDVVPRHPDLEIVAGRGLALLPGFVNAHTHTVLLALKGTVEDWDGDVIYRFMSPISYAMTSEERAALATLGCLEAIRSGSTTLVDPFRHVAGYAGAMAATGMRLVLSESCADIDTRRIRHGDYSVDPAFGDETFRRAVELIERWHGAADGRVTCQVAAHAPDNCSPAMLARLRALASQHGLGRTCHLAQSPGEVAATQSAYGLTPAAYLEREGFLGPDLVCAHWTFCTPADVELLASRKVWMAHCPASSSRRRGAHRVPVGLIRDAGVRIAFGTDNMSEDMFATMAIGSLLHRAGRGREEEGGTEPGPGAILLAATADAARSAGLEDQTGTLTVGAAADLVLLDLASPALRPINDLVSNVVHYGHPGTVHSTMVDGVFLMRDRRVLTIDEPGLVAEAQAVTERVWDRMVGLHPDLAPAPGALLRAGL